MWRDIMVRTRDKDPAPGYGEQYVPELNESRNLKDFVIETKTNREVFVS